MSALISSSNWAPVIVSVKCPSLWALQRGQTPNQRRTKSQTVMAYQRRELSEMSLER